MKFAASRLAVAFAALCPLSHLAAAQTAATPTVTLHSMVGNPTGVQWGFWENSTYQYQSLHSFGRRPVARVGIVGWDSIEKVAGRIDWSDFDAQVLPTLQATHQYGETVLHSVNISFTSLITAGKSTIPKGYVEDITHPTTRAAALSFVRQYVQHVAAGIGSFTLTFDYEIGSNYRLFSRQGDNCTAGAHWSACRDARAATWGAWYAEAVDAGRAAVREYNAAHPDKPVTVIFQPILNSDIADPGNAMRGAAGNAWLDTVVAQSDQVAVDSYHCVDGQPVTDAHGALTALVTWAGVIDSHGGASKKLVVAENGFSSGLTGSGPTTCSAATDGKYKGTEAEQRDYFANLFPLLTQATQSGGSLRGRLAAFNIWSIIDNPRVSPPDTDHYFGVLGQPDSQGADAPAKLATPVVASGLAGFESGSDSSLWPSQQLSSSDVTTTLKNGVDLPYTDGVNHAFLRYRGPKFAAGVACSVTLKLGSAQAGDMLLLRVNGQDWIAQPAVVGSDTSTTVPLSAAQCSASPNAKLQVDAYVAGHYFPLTRKAYALAVQRR